MTDQPLYGYFGHHKGATTWTAQIIREVCDYLGLAMSVLPNERVFDKDLQSYAARNKIDFVCYVNADYDYVQAVRRPLRGFHVVRDPRDIAVSSYFSHLYSHPTTSTWPALAEHRAKLQELAKDDGLRLEILSSRWEFEHLYKWDYQRPDMLELQMETLTQHPQQEYQRVFRFLGLLNDTEAGLAAQSLDSLRLAVNRALQRSRGRLPVRLKANGISPARLQTIVDANQFTKLAGGREPGQEDVKSHYRKGVAGDWRNHFNEEHIALFKENFNDLLIRLGYETDDRW